ncbi:MAG: RDD family protein [Pseudomonadota bacterium]
MNQTLTSTTDTIRRYETPEGVQLQLKLAGPVVRACAWAIDMLIKGVIYMAISMTTAFFGGVGVALMLIGFFLLEWFFPVIFEVHSGATPGKKAMGLLVVHDNGTPVSLSASLIRNLLRVADFFPVLYGAGLISMLSNRNFQRMGDMVAGTLVVYRDDHTTDITIPRALPKPPPAQLSVDELRNLIAFAERSNRLSEERRVELANQLEALTGLQGQAAVNELYAYANWLTRGR